MKAITTQLSVAALLLSTLVIGLTTQTVERPLPQTEIVARQSYTSTLSILPSELDLALGTTTRLSVAIGADDAVSAANLNLSFNSQVLKVKDITAGDFFPRQTVLLKEIDQEAGTVRFALGGFSGKTGQGQIAFLEVAAVGVGQTTVSLSGSQLAAIGEKEDVLGNSLEGRVRVQE